jgi:hypothetical protein
MRVNGKQTRLDVVSGVRVSGTLPPRESRVPRLNAVTRQRGSLCSPDTGFQLTHAGTDVFDEVEDCLLNGAFVPFTNPR